MLAYFVLPAIAFLFLEPFRRNRFIRFHSFQCLFTMSTLVVVHLMLAFVAKVLPIFTLLLLGILALAEFTLWLLLLFKAYQHQMFKLPFVGDPAEKWAERN
jgi:uncharacterized membrane protein